MPLSSFHRPAAQKILSGDVWEAETIEFMSVNAPEGDIVHAGSYFGDFIPALSRSRKSGAKVWVFEPNPENFRCAKITIYINELENVQLIKACLGAEKATIPMMIPSIVRAPRALFAITAPTAIRNDSPVSSNNLKPGAPQTSPG